ncbi:MAG: tyrosine-protein phosphatase [Alphaproteobacteria bacterium]|nr:tyrosine-protein phosphatase [Alphaproteobacteria bacterium]
MRGAQPFTRGQWEALHKRHRFASVLNLRGDNPKAGWYKDEIASASAHHCQHVNLMISSKRLPTRESLLQLLDAFRDLPRPLLIKCAGGSDRTGLASAFYFLDSQGAMALPEAWKHLNLIPYLHRPKPQQRWIKEMLHFFSLTHKGEPLRDWIATVYSEETLGAYLIAQNKGDYWRRDKERS